MLSAVQRVLKDDPELSKKEKSSQHYGGGTLDQRNSGFSKRDCLSFHCFSPYHLASACKENVKCSICGSRRHKDLLHLSSEERKDKTKKAEKATNTEPNVNAKCTAIRKDAPEGSSYGKNTAG